MENCRWSVLNSSPANLWQSLSKNEDRLPFPLSPPLPTLLTTNPFQPMDLHQGDCIRLPKDLAGEHASSSHLYQVIGFDARSDRCWLRCWPLARRGSPVFEVALSAVGTVACRHRPRAS